MGKVDITDWPDGAIVQITCNYCGHTITPETKVGKIKLLAAEQAEYCEGCGCTNCCTYYRKQGNTLVSSSGKVIKAEGE